MSTKEITEGSIKELWKVSLPLMISYLSLMSMLFVDRIFLAKYSPEALNAAASAGTLGWALNLGLVTLASMSEVFVAQYNGAGRFNKQGEPVWQMVHLSLFSVFIFLFLGIWGSQIIYPAEAGLSQEALYFKWMMFISPFSVMQAAVGGFFIGRGKTMIIKWLAVLGNAINVILDPLFIFGYGPIPSMGIAGAAMATGIGIAIQAIILLILFLRKKNQSTYGTNLWHFKSETFIKCLKIGLPPAIFVTLELFAWALFYWMMKEVSSEHIFVASICQSILLLFLFFGFGLEKGAAAVSGNLIGGGRLNKVKKVLRSGFILVLIFLSVIVIPFALFSEPIINWFIHNPNLVENTKGAILDILRVKTFAKTGLILIAAYLFLENIRWLLSGILTSAGDTLFLMISGTISVWVFMIAPTYFFIVKWEKSIIFAYSIWIFYALISTSLSLFRFYQGRWKDKHVIEEEKLLNSYSLDSEG